jgi:hypothetical protein
MLLIPRGGNITRWDFFHGAPLVWGPPQPFFLLVSIFFGAPCKKIPPKFGEPIRSCMTPSQKKTTKNHHKTHKKLSKNPQKTLIKPKKTLKNTKKSTKNPHKNPQENQEVILFCNNIKIKIDIAMLNK